MNEHIFTTKTLLNYSNQLVISLYIYLVWVRHSCCFVSSFCFVSYPNLPSPNRRHRTASPNYRCWTAIANVIFSLSIAGVATWVVVVSNMGRKTPNNQWKKGHQFVSQHWRMNCQPRQMWDNSLCLIRLVSFRLPPIYV
jgi:hypothetical protein